MEAGEGRNLARDLVERAPDLARRLFDILDAEDPGEAVVFSQALRDTLAGHERGFAAGAGDRLSQGWMAAKIEQARGEISELEARAEPLNDGERRQLEELRAIVAWYDAQGEPDEE